MTEDRARVVIVGAGPAGVGVARGLAWRGVRGVVVLDRRPRVGGVPALCHGGGPATFLHWTRAKLETGQNYARWLEQRLAASGAEVRLESQVLAIEPGERGLIVVSPDRGQVRLTAEAVVLACGARERTPAERGWIYGSRPDGLLFARDLLGQDAAGEEGPVVVVGSDVLAYSAAAGLAAKGIREICLMDRARAPECPWPARLYFGSPVFEDAAGWLRIAGKERVTGVQLAGRKQVACRRVVFAGALVPNDELLRMAATDLDGAGPEWFSAGNLRGASHSAGWCYRDGGRVSAEVARYLKQRAGQSPAGR